MYNRNALACIYVLHYLTQYLVFLMICQKQKSQINWHPILFQKSHVDDTQLYKFPVCISHDESWFWFKSKPCEVKKNLHMCTHSSTEFSQWFSKIPEARHLNFPTLYYSIVSQNMIRKLGRRATTFFFCAHLLQKNWNFPSQIQWLFFLIIRFS